MNSAKSDKWWYRLVQVAYVLFIILSLFIVVLASAESFPTLNEHGSRYQIVCDNGVRQNVVTGSVLNYSQTDFTNDILGQVTRFSCSRTELSGDELKQAYLEALIEALIHDKPSYTSVYERVTQGETTQTEPLIPKERNYQMVLVEAEYYGSWLETITAWIFGLITVVIIAIVLRATFLYIAFKEPLWRNILIFKRNKKL